MAGNLSELELAIQSLVDIYEQYAGKTLFGKRRQAISGGSFKKLLSQELHHMLTNTGDKQAVTKLLGDVDANADKKISFEEYWAFIGEIAGTLFKLQMEGVK